MKFKCTNIQWDTDGENVNLPDTAVVTCDSIEDVCDALSDKYGFCLKWFEVEKVRARKCVTFGMVWQSFGVQSIDLPDDIDENDKNAVIAYIKDHWAEIPLPDSGDYIADSDELDEEYIEIHLYE